MSLKHILLIDDDSVVVRVLSDGLRKLGSDYVVETAGSGEEALTKIQQHPYDVVITDYRMPGISGLDLAREIRQRSPTTAVVLMTAYGTSELRASAQGLGIEYIDKPFPVNRLREIVKRLTHPPPFRPMQGLEPVVLLPSEAQIEAFTRCLSELRAEIDAHFILLADALGHVIADVGFIQNVDVHILLSLMSGSFATAFEMARHLGQPQALSLNYLEGERYDVYSANVGDHLFLAIFYNKAIQPSRIGTVWLYTKRAIQRLQEIAASSPGEAAPLDSLLSPDFDFTLDRELESLFGEGGVGR